MLRVSLHFILALFISTFAVLSSSTLSRAEVNRAPRFADSPYDLINAVNSLRASHGLVPYVISSTLMGTAQNQADYMAATGRVSHTGVGGSLVTERLLAAGYPLAGDLSLGGFRSENITAGSEGMSAQTAVDQWMGDALHLNTMISPDLTEIGAGVSVNGGRIFFVIDCALPTASGMPQAAGTPVTNGSPVPATGGVILPVVVSTPNEDGNRIHEVKAGQSLWQIAISYETKIDEIKRLNNLSDDNIYPGQKLLIGQGVLVTPTLPPELATVDAGFPPTSLPVFTIAHTASASLPAPRNEPLPSSPKGVMGIVMGILVAAILGGGLVSLLGNTKK